MIFRRSRTVSLINGRVPTATGTASSIRFGDRIMALDEQPHPDDAVVDLEGAFVLPGLINAHDHLELNHFGRLKCRDRYANATAWIDDLTPALQSDPHIRKNSGYPLRDRLFIGGLKNVLAGVTTVAHHNPLYRDLRREFPVRVVRKFGWAHSFALEGRPVGANGERGGKVSEEHQATPSGIPFIVHAAEGVDEPAADEITRLETLGCLRPGTVLVHGVALTEDSWVQLLKRDVSLVWCPASNAFLFGQTIPARAFLDASADASLHLCLGSDSRVTGSRDLLDEMRAALAADPVTPPEVLQMVTAAAARVLKLPEAGEIAVGQPADLLVVPGEHPTAAESLVQTRRADVSLVTIGGRPMVAGHRFGAVFRARGVETQPIRVDGTDHVAAASLARDIARCPIQEPGVSSCS
ncbi:MAG TPA: amidohydrolase family protein [Vicinamibacterales bacterium]